jgi:hypothetical protein
MSRNINNIDDLLRDSFEDFSSEPSPAVRAKLSTSVRNFNFLKFNPGSFNVFYLTAIILGTSAIVSFSTGVFSSDSEYSETTKNTELKKDTATESSVIEKTTNSDVIVPNTEITASEKNIVNSNGFFVPQTDVVNDSELSVFSPGIINQSDNFETEAGEIADSNSIPEEKSFIFDTIVETVKIVVTDTITTEVRKTVEMRKNRRNKK